MLAVIRQFFAENNVLEVTTPVLGKRGVSDPHIENMRVGRNFVLQSSPEYAMKRILAAGTGAIYQICPAFRAGESGVRHNPEFTMLEWYQPGYELGELMDELSLLFHRLCLLFGKDVALPKTVSYKALFHKRFGVNPHQASTAQLLAIAKQEFPDLTRHISVDNPDEGLANDVLDLLFSSGLEDNLASPHFVTGFPASQAALARVAYIENEPVANRFEFFWQGIELANGYNGYLPTPQQHALGGYETWRSGWS